MITAFWEMTSCSVPDKGLFYFQMSPRNLTIHINVTPGVTEPLTPWSLKSFQTNINNLLPHRNPNESPLNKTSSFMRLLMWTWIARSEYRLATGWTVRGSNLHGGEIFSISPDRPWGPPSRLHIGYWVFSGGKMAGGWRWPPTQSSAKVKERVQQYLYSPSGLSWPVLEWPYLYLYLYLVVFWFLTCAASSSEWTNFFKWMPKRLSGGYRGGHT